MFGKGQREELDDEEGAELVQAMRAELALEVQRVKENEGVDLSQGSSDKQRGKL